MMEQKQKKQQNVNAKKNSLAINVKQIVLMPNMMELMNQVNVNVQQITSVKKMTLIVLKLVLVMDSK